MLLTVKELASHLHIKPSTLYAWAGQGRIPCLKIHGLLWFRARRHTVPGSNAPREEAVQTRSQRAMTWRTYLQTSGYPNWNATGTE